MKRSILIAVLLLLSAVTAAAQTVNVRFVTATPTVSNGSIYASGDAIGGLMTFTNACMPNTSQAEIRGVTILDKAAQGADVDLVIFNDNPSATTVTDNAALDVADADLAKIATVVQVTTDASFADNGISQAKNLSYEIPCNSSNTFYGVLVSRGTPTYGSTTEVTVQIEIYTR